MPSKINSTPCYCTESTGDLPTFHPDNEFVDESGFACDVCQANVDYLWDEDEDDPDEDGGEGSGCHLHGSDRCSDPICIRAAGGSVLAAELADAERWG